MTHPEGVFAVGHRDRLATCITILHGILSRLRLVQLSAIASYESARRGRVARGAGRGLGRCSQIANRQYARTGT